MEAFSPSKPLPEGVKEADLYDGPKLVPKILAAPIPPPPDRQGLQFVPPVPVATAQLKRDYPAAIELALDVLSARLLGLIALVTACIVWGGVIWEPDPWRIIAASGFSVLVFSPIMVIYWRSGLQGEGG